MIDAGTGGAQGVTAVQRPVSTQRGATSVEYAIVASLIAAVIVAAVTVIGTQVIALFQSVIAAMGW